MTNTEYAAGLRAIAEFYETHPDMPQPLTPHVYTYDKATFLLAVRNLADGGIVYKKAGEDLNGYYIAHRQFEKATLEISIPRKTVCRLVTPAVYDCPDSLLDLE